MNQISHMATLWSTAATHLLAHPQTKMAGQEASEQRALLCPKPENDTRCSTLTITNIKVLESQFWTRIIQKDFAVQCEHHGMFCHVNHTPHNIACLPRAPIVLTALVPPLGLGTEESLSQRKPAEQHPPTPNRHDSQ